MQNWQIFVFIIVIYIDSFTAYVGLTDNFQIQYKDVWYKIINPH